MGALKNPDLLEKVEIINYYARTRARSAEISEKFNIPIDVVRQIIQNKSAVVKKYYKEDGQKKRFLHAERLVLESELSKLCKKMQQKRLYKKEFIFMMAKLREKWKFKVNLTSTWLECFAKEIGLILVNGQRKHSKFADILAQKSMVTNRTEQEKVNYKRKNLTVQISKINKNVNIKSNLLLKEKHKKNKHSTVKTSENIFISKGKLTNQINKGRKQRFQESFEEDVKNDGMLVQIENNQDISTIKSDTEPFKFTNESGSNNCATEKVETDKNVCVYNMTNEKIQFVPSCNMLNGKLNNNNIIIDSSLSSNTFKSKRKKVQYFKETRNFRKMPNSNRINRGKAMKNDDNQVTKMHNIVRILHTPKLRTKNRVQYFKTRNNKINSSLNNGAIITESVKKSNGTIDNDILRYVGLINKTTKNTENSAAVFLEDSDTQNTVNPNKRRKKYLNNSATKKTETDNNICNENFSKEKIQLETSFDMPNGKFNNTNINKSNICPKSLKSRRTKDVKMLKSDTHKIKRQLINSCSDVKESIIESCVYNEISKDKKISPELNQKVFVGICTDNINETKSNKLLREDSEVCHKKFSEKKTEARILRKRDVIKYLKNKGKVKRGKKFENPVITESEALSKNMTPSNIDRIAEFVNNFSRSRRNKDRVQYFKEKRCYKKTSNSDEKVNMMEKIKNKTSKTLGDDNQLTKVNNIVRIVNTISRKLRNKDRIQYFKKRKYNKCSSSFEPVKNGALERAKGAIISDGAEKSSDDINNDIFRYVGLVNKTPCKNASPTTVFLDSDCSDNQNTVNSRKRKKYSKISVKKSKFDDSITFNCIPLNENSIEIVVGNEGLETPSSSRRKSLRLNPVNNDTCEESVDESTDFLFDPSVLNSIKDYNSDFEESELRESDDFVNAFDESQLLQVPWSNIFPDLDFISSEELIEKINSIRFEYDPEAFNEVKIQTHEDYSDSDDFAPSTPGQHMPPNQMPQPPSPMQGGYRPNNMNQPKPLPPRGAPGGGPRMPGGPRGPMGQRAPMARPRAPMMRPRGGGQPMRGGVRPRMGAPQNGIRPQSSPVKRNPDQNSSIVKRKKLDVLSPSDKDDDDCQVICMQPKNTDGGLPQIESVHGGPESAENSIMHLSDSITLSVRNPPPKPVASPQKSDAKAVANILATRGITVTASAKPKEKDSPTKTPALPTALSLNGAVSIVASPKNNGASKSPQSEDLPTVDLTDDSAPPKPSPTKKGLPYRCDLCPAQYPNAVGLNKHRQTYHKTAGGMCELGVPLINLKQPGIMQKLSQLGINSYIPMPSAAPDGTYALPIINTKQPGNVAALGATQMLSLGPVRTIPRPAPPSGAPLKK
ncbi:uncharacterized protein LOC115882556 isoform X1 [Sitophilus oryzae]|uniref:Uncharacterized protein LOC115882556 isoform X1 n=1 Tax=Sitophilus oryzae TaxID=7048 RepID=A0A6J2Y0X9_SITOR|nr:uncharacterized protein LOC115882556 isoform X1 [Sitophilus oryzae]